MKQPNPSRRTPMQRIARVLFPLITAMLTVQPLAYAAPTPSLLAQAPLFVDNIVPANASFILDDSLSMASGRLPMPPGITSPATSGNVTVMREPATGGLLGWRSGEPTGSVQAQDLLYRAPSLNPQYYNPAITYSPWNNNGTPMPQASFAMTPRADGFRPGQTRHDMRFRGPNYTSSPNLMALNTAVGANAQTFTTTGAVESPSFVGVSDGGQNIDLFSKPMAKTFTTTSCVAWNFSFVYNVVTTPAVMAPASCSVNRVNRTPGPGTQWREEIGCTETWGPWGPFGGTPPASRLCPAANEGGSRAAWTQSNTPGPACPGGTTDMGGAEPRCCPNASFVPSFVITPAVTTPTPCSGTTGPLACPCTATAATGIGGCPSGQTCPLANTWYTAPNDLVLARYYRYEFTLPAGSDALRQSNKSCTGPGFTDCRNYRLVEIDRDVPTRVFPVVDADGRPARRAPAAGETALPNHCLSQAPFDGSVCSWQEEAQNFANWYTYYRSRLFAAIGVSAAALAKVTAGNNARDRLRLAYGSLNYFPTAPDPYAPNPNQTRLPNTLTVDPTAGAEDNAGILVRGVREFLEGTPERQQVFNWLFSLRAIGATPNREVLDSVGRYYTRTDQLGPWADNPGAGGGRPQAAHIPCRRNFTLLITDGEWTNSVNVVPTAQSQPRLEDMPSPVRANPPLASQSAATIFNARSQDGPIHTGPGGQTYQYKLASEPQWTVTGNPTGTLTDAALYYWSRDLRPDLDNTLPATSTNEAFWQSMTTYIVGFGITASRDNAATRNAVAAKTAPSPVWPAVNTTAGVITDRDTTPVNCGFNTTTNPSGCGRVDDTMRAALAGRGDFLAASNVEELARKVADALSKFDAISAAGAAPAATRSRVEAGDRVFVATFKTNDWFGELKSYDAVTYVNELTTSGELSTAPQWNASFPAWNTRAIFTSTGSVGAGVPFLYGSLTPAQKTAVGSSNVVDYVRGNQALEAPPTGFRNRSGRLLGDIVNSDPIYSKANDFGFDAARSPAAASGNGASYPAFVTSNKSGRRAAVYVGANAGKLHAFDAATGQELFAYVPRATLAQLPQLTFVDYAHKYFVDGPVVQGDVYLDSAWRSVVVGTSGNGPKSIFALDVTNPAPVAENGRPAFGASNVLWDLTGADHPDIGNITEPGFIASGKDGNWYYFVGNGWESQNDKATLLAINLKTGAVLSIATDAAGGSNSAAPTRTAFLDRTNGLGGVTPVYDAQRNVVAVYGGDRLGRLWKFDLSSTSTSNWKVATTGGLPLFVAINSDDRRQAITAAPRLTQHPAGGNFIVFGTGKLYDVADKTDTSVQSVYALWEKPGSNDQIASDRAVPSMLKLTLSDVPPPSGTRFDRAVDGEENINWSTHVGWYFDLATTAGVPGERLISSPSDVGGFVQFGTFAPVNNASPCEGNGSSYFYRLAVASNLSQAFTAPRSAAVIGVPILPTTEVRMISKAAPVSAVSTRDLNNQQLAAAIAAPPGAGSGNCPPGTFSTVTATVGLTPVGVTCLAPPLRSWRELPRGPR